MTSRNHFTSASAILLALGLAACGSISSHERTIGIGNEFSAVGTSLSDLKVQVDESLQALGSLTDRGEAESAFATITTTAAAIVPAIDSIKSTLVGTEQEGKTHFESWSRQNATIQDAELRVRANERQTELASLMTTSAANVTKAVSMGDGYARSLQDLQQYLTNDLSPTAVGNAADLIARIRAQGDRFSTALDSAIKDTTHFAAKIDG